MPRVKLGVNEKALEFEANITYFMKLRGCQSIPFLAKGIGISAPTVYKALKRPDDVKFGTIRRIQDYLRVPEERRIKT